MRKLANKVNVDPPDGDYPFGRAKNNPGDRTGTPVDEELLGDILQFFEKIMDDSAIVPNELPDNDYSGFQLFDALISIIEKNIEKNYSFGEISTYRDSAGVESTAKLKKKVIEIGDWNMDTTPTVSILHGLAGDVGFTTIQQIREIQVLIRSDTGLMMPLNSASVSDGPNGAINAIDAFSINLIRYAAPGEFDNGTYDQTPFNRGWITITYEI